MFQNIQIPWWVVFLGMLGIFMLGGGFGEMMHRAAEPTASSVSVWIALGKLLLALILWVVVGFLLFPRKEK